jgi:hypothetical protein
MRRDISADVSKNFEAAHLCDGSLLAGPGGLLAGPCDAIAVAKTGTFLAANNPQFAIKARTEALAETYSSWSLAGKG